MQQGTLSLQSIIDQVSKEKGINAAILVETMEQAILTAAKRTFGVNRELEARYNQDTGAVDLYQYMIVVENVENSEREIGANQNLQGGNPLGTRVGWQTAEEAISPFPRGRRVSPVQSERRPTE